MSDNPEDSLPPPQPAEAATESAAAPVTAPARPNRNLRTVLIIAGIALLLCCVGGGIGGYLIYRGVDGITGSAADTTDAFLDDIEDGNYARAYARYCDAAKRQLSEEKFITTFTSNQVRLTSHKIIETSVSEVNGEATARVTVELASDGGRTSTETFRLIRPGGTWQICD